MEEKKLDLNSIIGFILIFGILIWIMYQNQPSEQEIAADKAKKELVLRQEKEKAKRAIAPAKSEDTNLTDSTEVAAFKATLGGFAYSASLPSAKENFTTIENNLIKIVIANKGGFITEATLKDQEKYKKGSGQLVSLIKDKNADLNLILLTQDNRTLQTKDLFF
jgi:YidC/Oxa1 family membrane protein insertase